MRFIELRGSPAAMGEQYGAAFADDIRKYYALYCLRRSKHPELDPSIQAYLERRCPWLVEEMEGISRGAGMTFKEIMAYNHFKLVKKGCTPVFFRDTEAGPILAQNLDTGPLELEALVMRVVRPKDGLAFISPVIVGTVWAGTCMNEKGVCMSGVSAYTKRPATENGAVGGVVARDAIQHAETADDLVRINNSHTILSKTGVGIAADLSGKAFRIERDNVTKLATPLGEFGFSTGLYESEKIEQGGTPAGLQMKRDRANTVRRLYEEGKIEFSVTGMKRLLSHHCSPGPVCRHLPWEGDGTTGTQASRIMIPSRMQFLMAEGPPCRNTYREYTL